MSDWQATRSGVAAIEAGLVSIISDVFRSYVLSELLTHEQDMDMPGGLTFGSAASSFFGGNITTAV